MKRLLLLVAASAALALVPAAQAGPIVDKAVAALQSSPVYVDPGAELAISSADQNELREKIDSAGAGPVYIAILPAAAEQEAGGSPDGVLQALHDALGRKGTYAAVIGRHFRAGSDVLAKGVAGRLADRGARRPPRPGRDGDAAGLHRPRGDGALRRDEWWRRRR